jgi:hypothetical protein
VHILIVEDEPQMASLLARGLEEELYEVSVAKDGKAALDLSTSQEFDVILLDVMLPKIGGLEVARQLRQREQSTPLLIRFFGLTSLPACGIGSEYWEVRRLWWCRGPESNWLRPPFQGGALPVSYPGTLFSSVGSVLVCVKLGERRDFAITAERERALPRLTPIRLVTAENQIARLAARALATSAVYEGNVNVA